MAACAIRPEVAHELAHALESSGERDEAIAVFQELTRIRPGNGRHLRCLGLALRKRGRVQEADAAIDAAIAVLREEIRQRPEDPWPRRNLGLSLADRGKHQEAVAELRKALAIIPDDAELHDALGLALRGQGEVDAAIGSFREAIQLKKDLARAHFDLGDVMAYNKNEYLDAEAEYREGIRLSGGDHASYEWLGDILNRQGKFKEAIAELRTAAQIDPTCSTVRRYLGDALLGQRKLEDAVVEYREALRLRPDDASSLYNIDKLLTDLGKVDALIAEYREMIRLRPDWDASLNGLAWKLVLAPDRPCAITRKCWCTRKCVTLNAKDGSYWNTLALAEYRVHHWNEAIAAAKRSIDLRSGGGATIGSTWPWPTRRRTRRTRRGSGLIRRSRTRRRRTPRTPSYSSSGRKQPRSSASPRRRAGTRFGSRNRSEKSELSGVKWPSADELFGRLLRFLDSSDWLDRGTLEV